MTLATVTTYLLIGCAFHLILDWQVKKSGPNWNVPMLLISVFLWPIPLVVAIVKAFIKLALKA